MPKLNRLSDKQESFCRFIVEGFSGKDSYEKAYNCTGSEQMAYNEASKLLLKPQIQDRIKALNKPLEQAFQSNITTLRQQQIDFIKERIAICVTKEDENSIIKYTDMLNKIHGIYKETESTNETKNNLENIDITMLKKLAETG